MIVAVGVCNVLWFCPGHLCSILINVYFLTTPKLAGYYVPSIIEERVGRKQAPILVNPEHGTDPGDLTGNAYVLYEGYVPVDDERQEQHCQRL